MSQYKLDHFSSEILDINKLESSKLLKDIFLWDNFRNGADVAFIQIYEQFFDCLYACSNRLFQNESQTKDGNQEVFFDLRRLRHKIGSTVNIKFYLLNCLKRKLQNYFSKWEHIRESLETSQDFDFTILHQQQLIDQQMGMEKTEEFKKSREILLGFGIWNTRGLKSSQKITCSNCFWNQSRKRRLKK
ncbi:hypothetical protein [Cyclobacterium qasimii]|uniref:Uncharacterized protein n=1 Tax=Cyclobacterium qasimii M12-11B TaxID=641524 RepID=S7VNC3_9BACT|nr:hypothetical protein [Cyclobacterium qasimii]EPR70877.1 hypothetical protein ADICYQ_0873 [Cyclobacterium qasimii M12-11B]